MVIRVLDEERDLLLPPKDRLATMGIDADRLKKGVLVSGTGTTSMNDAFKHRINRLEFQ